MKGQLFFFFKFIYSDINCSAGDLVKGFGAGVIIAIPIMGIVLAVAYFLCWLVGGSLENAVSAAVGILVFALLLVCLVQYLARKWKEARRALGGEQ